MTRCSKCSVGNKGLTTISVGTEDLYIKATMTVCWKCFKKEFQKHESKSVYIFKQEEIKNNLKNKNLKAAIKNKEVKAK